MALLDLLGVKRAPMLSAADATPATSPVAAAGLAPAIQLGNPWSMPADLAAVLPPVAGVPLPLTREQAMAVPAVARARHILCGRIAALELREYAGPAEDPVPVDQQAPWIARTDAALPPSLRMLWTVDDLLFTGFSLWKRENEQDPTRSRPRPLKMDRVARHRWSFDPAGRIELDGEVPDANDVALIIGPHEGLLNFASGVIRHAANLQRNAEIAAATPSANLELHQEAGEPYPKEKVDELLAAWRAARAGANGGVAYTSPNIIVREHGSYDAHLLIDGRNAAAVDVARSASLPADVIDAATESSMTYSNSRDNDRRLVDYGLSLYMGCISASLSVDAIQPRGRRVAFDLEKWLPSAGLATNATPATNGSENQ